jgi:hypothetical protein
LGECSGEGVLATAIAGFADFAQQLQDGYRGVVGSAFTQVIAMGVDEGGSIAAPPDPLSLVDSRVAFDGVQSEVQPTVLLAGRQGAVADGGNILGGRCAQNTCTSRFFLGRAEGVRKHVALGLAGVERLPAPWRRFPQRERSGERA